MKRIVILCAVLAWSGRAWAGDGKQSAVLLLKVTTPDGTVTTFGQGGGDGGAGGAALAHEIEGLGLKLRPAGAQAIPVTGESDPRLPIGDQAAIELARHAGASVAWVAGIDVRADGPVRGTRLEGAAGRGAVRVLDVASGNAIGSAEVEGAGFDRALGTASAAAARDIAERLARAVGHDVSGHWPSAAASGGPSVLVSVRGARTWGSVAAVIRKLGSTEGILAVHAREVRRGHVALAVETRLAAGRVAAAAERARLPSGTARASARGDGEVNLEIRGETMFSDDAAEPAETGPAAETGPGGAEPSDQD